MKAANELYFLAAEAVAYLQVQQRLASKPHAALCGLQRIEWEKVQQRFASKPHAALYSFTANRVGKRVNGKWQNQ